MSLVKNHNRVLDLEGEFFANRRCQDIVVGNHSDVDVRDLGPCQVVRAGHVSLAYFINVLDVVDRLCQDSLRQFLKVRVHIELCFPYSFFTAVVKRARSWLGAGSKVFEIEIELRLVPVFTLDDVFHEDLFLIFAEIFLVRLYFSPF